jgi:hypothetical protein
LASADDEADDVDDDVDEAGVENGNWAGNWAGAGAEVDDEDDGIIDMYDVDEDGYIVDDGENDDEDDDNDEDYMDESGIHINDIFRTIATRQSPLVDRFENQMHILLAMHEG